MSTQRPTGEVWAELGDMEEEQRESLMEERYLELAALSEEERQAQLRALAPVEYTLPDDKIWPFHRSRLRTWLRMDQSAARRVADSYHEVMQQMPADVGMRRVSIVQTVARSLPLEEEERLRDLVPRVFGETPHGVTEAPESLRETVGDKQRKPWWRFWAAD